MKKQYAIAVLLFVAYGCATTSPAPPQVPPTEALHGVASWYGEEFAGRTTANGEIFDPLLLTAAHRTLPFGTVLDVKNAKTGQTVRVRINDRGPFVGNRMIDLSFAAAQKIGLVEPGSGDVDVTIVKLGLGDREPPVPYTIALNNSPQTPAQPKETVKISSDEAPKVEFPLPTQTATKTTATTTATTTSSSDADFGVQVVVEKQGVETRRQVAADGTTIQDVPVAASAPAGASGPVPSAASGSVPSAGALGSVPPAGASGSVPPAARPSPAAGAAPSPGGRGLTQVKAAARFFVQAGAFGVEANAKALQQQLASLGFESHIEHDQLYRVRMGPYPTREEAIRARGGLEAKGMSAIVIGE